MNSKLKSFVAALLAAMFTVPAGTTFAADEHTAHHPTGDAGAAAPADATASMQKMREQMAAIRTTKDPKERARLLDEHMKTMQSTMQQMRDDSGCMMMGQGAGMQKGQAQGGMSMMHMMMEQMQQHQEAMRGGK